MAPNKINLKDLPTLLPHNINWHDFFKNNYPIDLEIGCGRTHFFFDRALNFPQRNIVGVEWKYEFIKQAHRRILKDNIKNAAAFHGNAWLLVPLLFPHDTISQVFINFPDPWWKGRHKKRLILNQVFLMALVSRMRTDSSILLQTDVADLFGFYRKLLTESKSFYLDESLSQEQLIEETKAKTHREKKCLEQGLAIYRGLFRRLI